MSKNKDFNIKELWKTYQKKKTLKNRNKLVEYYYPFVKKIAYKVAKKLNWKVQPQELTSFGVDGLYKAIESFNLERGVKFESYASQRIRGSMIDGLRREDIIPRSVRIASDQFDKHRQRLENHFGHRISDPEFIELVGMNEVEFQKNFKRYHPAAFSSLDCPSINDADSPLKQDSNINLEDKSAATPEAKAIRREFFSKLLGKNFTKTERTIIYLYYYEDLTMDKVAKAIGLSESRVSQIHKNVIKRLKDKICRNPDFFNEDICSYIDNCNDKYSLS